ncbi:WSCD family member CG9164-like [Halichondria panicea]|uniref:WSCD family member CG9164-like n=1 Tax=Halichondria panicea TaxID=6063 RepID=UPI00312B4807
MSKYRRSFFIAVLAVLGTMVSFGLYHVNLRNDLKFDTEDVGTKMVPTEISVTIGVSKETEMATQEHLHKEFRSLAPSSKRKAASPHKKKQPPSVSLSIINQSTLFKSNYPPPTINGYTCQDSMCSEFLKPLNMRKYKADTTKILSDLSSDSKIAQASSINGPCHFMNGSNRPAVALASFPGSGNTWTRGLLEKATGVCTGSVYMDRKLRESGFNGERMITGVVCVVKTHFTDKAVPWTNSSGDISLRSFSGYGSAILIVRNPFDALVSEWTRKRSHSHTGATNPKYFSTNKNWDTFVRRESKQWSKYFRTWMVESHDHPTMLVRYEDLKVDLVSNVEKMLDFLSFPYDHQELENHLTKDFTKFKRKHNGVTVDHFTAEQKNFVRSIIKQTLSYLREYNHGDTLNIEEYLS